MDLKEAVTRAGNEADEAKFEIGQSWAATFVMSLEQGGFSIVPKEATDDMAKASCELDCTRQECQRAGRCRGYPEKLNAKREHWDSMLAVRPKIEATP